MLAPFSVPLVCQELDFPSPITALRLSAAVVKDRSLVKKDKKDKKDTRKTLERLRMSRMGWE